MFVFFNVDLATQSSIYLRRRGRVISLQALSDAGTQKRVAGIRGGAKSKVARIGIYDRSAPTSLEYGEQAQAGMVTYTRETCSKFSHEVSSGRLAPFLSATPDSARPLRLFGGTLDRDHGDESVSSLGPELSTRRKNATGKRARRGARILAGVALRPVGGDFPDTEICLRREPPHPREALPTSDIDFPGENRIEVYLRYSTDSGGKGERGEGGKQNDFFRPSLPPRIFISVILAHVISLFSYRNG